MVKLIGGGTDLNTVVSDMNTNLLELKNNEVVQYFKDETGTRRVLLGKGADGFYGMKVSKTGNDVYTAADSQLVFNSSQNVLKVVASGTGSLTPPASWASGNTVTTTIAHGATGTPAFIVYVQNPNIAGYHGGGNALTTLPSSWFIIQSTGGGITYMYNQARVDSTNLYIDLTNLSSGTVTGMNAYTWNYKYYILMESAL